MASRSTDQADYQLLTAPGASMQVGLAVNDRGEPEVQMFGNRAGVLSLANVLLYLVANAWRRELLSLAELPFVQVEGALTVCLRQTAEDASGRDGRLARLDGGEQFEWIIAEDDLRRVALNVHRLASDPAHEYDRLLMEDESAAGVHVRMTDAREWLGGGHAARP